MANPLSRRLDKLEGASTASNRARVAVIVQPVGESEEAAEARHYAAHPEDLAAGLVVVLRRFAPSPSLPTISLIGR